MSRDSWSSMPSHKITWAERIDRPWLAIQPCRVGNIPSGLGTPAKYILLTTNDHPAIRVDAYGSPDECFAFHDATIWHDHLVVGWGAHVYLIHLCSRTVVTHHLGDYFGHLYSDDDWLLVASANRLLRFSPDASILWHSDLLGIDGVVVDHVDGSVINGAGEWDPPGGWRSFQIDLGSGNAVEQT